MRRRGCGGWRSGGEATGRGPASRHRQAVALRPWALLPSPALCAPLGSARQAEDGAKHSVGQILRCWPLRGAAARSHGAKAAGRRALHAEWVRPAAERRGWRRRRHAGMRACARPRCKHGFRCRLACTCLHLLHIMAVAVLQCRLVSNRLGCSDHAHPAANGARRRRTPACTAAH